MGAWGEKIWDFFFNFDWNLMFWLVNVGQKKIWNNLINLIKYKFQVEN